MVSIPMEKVMKGNITGDKMLFQRRSMFLPILDIYANIICTVQFMYGIVRLFHIGLWTDHQIVYRKDLAMKICLIVPQKAVT